MNAPIVARLFRLAGLPPAPRVVARTLTRCPRERLVRAVAWYVVASTSRIAPAALLTRLRLVMRGWDDVYMTSSLPRDAARAELGEPHAREALVIRHARGGRGWVKDELPTRGVVRAEVALAARWLGSVAGCIVHDDCAANPALGAECASMSEDRAAE